MYHTFQTDETISFLRAARSGDLAKVLEFINGELISDINTCNAVRSLINVLLLL